MVSLDATTTSTTRWYDNLITVPSSVPPAMTGVPSRAARVVSEKNDGLRSKTFLDGRDGAWRLARNKEGGASRQPDTRSPIDELANPSPLSPAAPFQPPHHATIRMLY
jgi:hypothetical protein